MTNIRTALVFNPYRDVGQSVSYDADGDPSMHSVANEERRTALREHPAVVDAIGRMLCLYTRNGDEAIPKEEYVSKYLKIVALLMPSMSKAEAVEEAEVDWLTDADGDEEFISIAAMQRALFQLADIWCKSTQAEEYVAFLDTLGGRLGC